MAGGPLRKHPTSRALLLTPARVLHRCDACCGECEYAIRATRCNQTVDENCEPEHADIWLCATSRCEDDPLTLGDYKTGVVIRYMGVCYYTEPESITLASELSPAEQAALIDSQTLECVGPACDEVECGEVPSAVCGCLCRSLDSESRTDCCMAYWRGGSDPAPWTFTYSYVEESYISRQSFGAGGVAGYGCLETDCSENRACVYLRYEREIDYGALVTPIEEQGCTKVVPLRQRQSIRRIGTNPAPPPANFACCSEPNTAPNTWSSAGTLAVSPPTTIPLQETDDDSGVIQNPGDPCYSRVRTRTYLRGDCSEYLSVQTFEVWSFVGSGANCCQQYERETRTTRLTYQPATDDLTRRFCAQCRRAE